MDLLIAGITATLAARFATCLGDAILLWSGLFGTVGGTGGSTLAWCSGRCGRLILDAEVSRSAGGFCDGTDFH